MDSPLPVRLLKFYDAETYAEAFLELGSIRLRPLSYFVKTEDTTRADDSEGQGKLKVQGQELTTLSLPSGQVSRKVGELDWGVAFGNPLFIFCTSLPTVDLQVIGSKWPYAVEIHNPKLFRKDFEDGVTAAAPKEAKLLGIEGVTVQYDKGKIVLEKPDFGNSAGLAYSQKPQRFLNECEFRFAAIFDVIGFPEETPFIDITLRFPKDYARRVGMKILDHP